MPSVDYVKEKCAKVQVIKSFLHTVIEEHKSNFDENNIRDFIDAYINEIKARKTIKSKNSRGLRRTRCSEDKTLQHTSDETSSFHISEGFGQLSDTLIDLFVAGSETVSSTLSFGLLFMIR